MALRARSFNILVPRFIDADNHNAQNLNAKALLSRFESPNVTWHAFHYGAPDPAVLERKNVRCHQLIRGGLWKVHAQALYQGQFDGIVYPGNECFDAHALKWRARLGLGRPIVATFEGVPGDADREAFLAEKLGHPVRCFRPRSGVLWTKCHDAIHRLANEHIAISPYLKRVGEYLYGGKFSVLPLGVDTSIFSGGKRNCRPSIPMVVGAGTLYEAKRPQLFLEMASEFPTATFTWFGDGPLRNALIAKAKRLNLGNLSFPGALPPRELAGRFRESSMFVLPSYSEGVPKVSQEAASCGLPVVLFGFYEAPTVIDGLNGYVVWSDTELMERVAELIASPKKCAEMGRLGAELSSKLSWEVLAPQWEAAILGGIENR